MKSFGGKSALVTGGAGGIGSAICESLARSGCRVFLHDLPASGGGVCSGTHLESPVEWIVARLSTTACPF